MRLDQLTEATNEEMRRRELARSPEHRVHFKAAFDDMVNGCHHESPGDHGRGAVRMTMISLRERYAAEWDLSTGWHLPETETEGKNIYGAPLDLAQLRKPNVGAINLHSPNPRYEGQEDPVGDCDFTGTVCYFDVAYVAADDVMDAMLRGGDSAVWSLLDEWVSRLIEEAAEFETTRHTGRGRHER